MKIATLSSGTNAEGQRSAADIFETLGRESLESRLGAYSAKGYFFQAILCLMATGDNVAARNKLEAFKNLDFSFGSSRESQFVDKLLEVRMHIEYI